MRAMLLLGHMTYDDVVRVGLELPEVEDTMSYRTPALKRKGRFMLRLKEDGATIAVKLDWETHDRLLAESPNVYFKTPHYDGYPALLARLELLDEAEARAMVSASWKDAPKPAKTGGAV